VRNVQHFIHASICMAGSVKCIISFCYTPQPEHLEQCLRTLSALARNEDSCISAFPQKLLHTNKYALVCICTLQ
jgi:hypothetical protein